MAKKIKEPTKKQHILIVEDDVAIIDVYSTALEFQGFSVVKAFNGQEGLQKALLLKPDMILLDILMPVMDGLTMLQTLRKTNDFGQKVPVIMLTNLSAGNEDIIQKIAETGPVEYIVKSSTTPRQMVDKIKKYFSSLKK